MRRLASLFEEVLYTLSTSTHRHYDESVGLHRIKQLTRGNNTIPYHHTIYDDFSDKVDLKLDNNNGFIADRSCRTMVVSTSQLHYFMLLCRTESRYKRQFGCNSLLFTAFKTV